MTHRTSQIKKIHIQSDHNFSDALARHIFSAHAEQLPDLSKLHILIPNAQAVTQMRNSLCSQAGRAIIPGFTGSLTQWLQQHAPLTVQAKNIISHSSRQLLLLEALKRHSELFADEHHWQLCDSLLELFDELSLSRHQWLDKDLPEWIEQLQLAYQAQHKNQQLTQEANIVQTLWQAWQQQLSDMQVADEKNLLKHQLTCNLPSLYQNNYFYIVGMEQLSPLELSWCEQLARQANVYHVTQGVLPDDVSSLNTTQLNNNLQLLHNIYLQDSAFIYRCKNHTVSIEQTFLNNITTFDAQSAEQEAHAVDLKIRSCLLNGDTNIGVVTENRKLARRLRALLDRAGVTIQDTAGWALATTSSATVIERWLECIEQDFAYQPFLDLLKSPFFCLSETHEAHINLIYRFEQDIILHENIANDLQRYRKAIKNRRERLNLKIASSADHLLELLQTIEQASTALSALFKQRTETTPDIWVETFIDSIQQLGIYQQLENDTAGMRIQKEIDKLSQAHDYAQPELNWQDFRTWLGSALERGQFKPHNQQAAVKIMNMQQAQYCAFDTLIIAGANMQSLPGTANQQAFFNNSVRQCLQLKNWQQQKTYSFYQFQQLLFAANNILITWQAEKNGEWLQVSPWVMSLENFAKHAFNTTLKDHTLDKLIQHIGPFTQRTVEQLDSIQTVSSAKPVLHKNLLPEQYSASRQQRLIDCPYKFFAADGLSLKPLEEISEELLKSEYGEKVHLILQAFHQQYKGLPAPFTQSICRENKTQALAHLEKLSRIVFNQHTEDTVQHRGWLERWLKTTDAYIEWQISRQQKWNIHQLEQSIDKTIDNSITLTGRLDRVDIKDGTHSIIDYKTGSTAHQDDIDLAENIQLTSYTNLLADVDNTIYLKLDNGEVKITGQLEQPQLETLQQDTLKRLVQNIQQIKEATPLPSWGDAQSCQYCDMSGLCRKQIWEVN